MDRLAQQIVSAPRTTGASGRATPRRSGRGPTAMAEPRPAQEAAA